MNVNKVILIGRLTKDPEMRTTATGQTVASFGLATNRNWTDKSGQKQEQTEFHNIVAWAKSAEIISQYSKKGSELYVEGRLQTRNWDDKQTGQKKYMTEIVIENFQLGARPTNTGGSYANQNPSAATAPAAAAGVAAATAPQAKQTPTDDIPTINLDDEKDDVNIEDVPF